MSVSFLAFGNDSGRKAEALALLSGAADSAAGTKLAAHERVLELDRLFAHANRFEVERLSAQIKLGGRARIDIARVLPASP